MELLDDNLELQPDSLTVRKLEAKIAIKNEYLEAKKIYGRAKLTTIIVTVLTLITFAFASANGAGAGFLEIGLLLIYIVAIFVPLEYSKYSFSVISFLYLLNFGLALITFSNGLLFIIVLVRLAILYFILMGAYSGFKVEGILNKMRTLDMESFRQ